MIHKSNDWTRRILTFPAVHPCESISPVTLVNSLIDLGNKICSYRSICFATNKRNARQAFRHVRNLLVFLEEIGNGSSIMPDSFALSLSELHLTFQKLLYLVEDCTRDGARTWMLTQSDRIANHFRDIFRAIAMSLDVFPFGSVDLSDEVNELIELLVRQTRKARSDVDPDDSRVINDIIWILGRFEDGVAPDPREIKPVLEYLGIRKWSNCNKEVKFLDSEIAAEYLNEEKKKEVELLSSLMGFMCYCRVVIFGSIDTGSSDNQQRNQEEFHGLNPDDFRCPISLEIMADPVTLSTGHTYDRTSILKWFRAGNRTCPNTGEKLTSTVLVPNLVVRRLVELYCSENGAGSGSEPGRKNRDLKRTMVAGSMAAEGAVKMLAAFIADRLVNGDPEETNRAAFEVRVLSKTSIFNRSCLVEAGTIQSLLKLLLSSDSTTQENAIAALLNLSKHSKSKSVIVDNGGLDLIVGVLHNGLKEEARQHAAAVLFYLASVEEYSEMIGEIPESIPSLIELIKGTNHHAKKNALVAIFGLLTYPDNHKRVLAAGTVSLLIELLRSADREYLITDSLAVLSSLAQNPDGCIAILRGGALNLIIGTLNSSSSRAGKEFCVSLLLALCINGGAVVVSVLVKNPSLMVSLYSLLNEGTSRASKKASALIRILHEFYEKSSSSTPRTPVLPGEQFIHVW